MNKILSILDNLNISYKLYEHPALYTVEDSSKYFVNFDRDAWDNKNLFLCNSSKTSYYLVTLEWHKRLDVKWLAKFLGEKKLSFAWPEELMKYLWLTPGSVSPFGLINDLEHQVQFIADKDLLQAKFVRFHPWINTLSVDISPSDFQKFLDFYKISVKYVECV